MVEDELRRVEQAPKNVLVDSLVFRRPGRRLYESGEFLRCCGWQPFHPLLHTFKVAPQVEAHGGTGVTALLDGHLQP
jgi:hypothetical protein